MSTLNREHNLVSSVETFHAEYVPVIFVDDGVEAEHYRVLLESHDIPVMVDDRSAGEFRFGDFPRAIPLLVPALLFDEASELVGRDEEAAARPKLARDEDDEETLEDEDDDEDLDDFDEDEDLDEADDEFEEDDDEDFGDEDEE